MSILDSTTGPHHAAPQRGRHGTKHFSMKLPADGLASTITFLDLKKAFEMVRLQDVWAAGRHFQFPEPMLRLMLEAFAFARRLTYQGAVL